MSHVNIFNIPKYTFAFKLLHTIEEHFGKQIQHKMKELSMSNE